MVTWVDCVVASTNIFPEGSSSYQYEVTVSLGSALSGVVRASSLWLVCSHVPDMSIIQLCAECPPFPAVIGVELYCSPELFLTSGVVISEYSGVNDRS